MKSIIKYSFKKSMPILFGYLFLASAVGILLEQAGCSIIEVLLIGMLVYAGTGQFMLAYFLMQKDSLGTVAIMTLLVNSRHMFYGLSFLDEFPKMGILAPYMIHNMTDETYSIRCFVKNDTSIDDDKKPEAMFWVGLFDHCYWLCGSLLGALCGKYLPLNLKGVDFSMTALFIILMIEQWKASKNHIPALVGLASSVGMYLVLGADKFLLPSLFLTAGALIVTKRKVEEKERGL